jgi:NADH:ubiquinone oxidoreductase subunit E
MWLKPCASYKEQITEVAFYAEADVRAIGTELKENERKQKEYDEDKKKYNDFIKATDGVRSDVRVCYREACQWMNAIEQATQILNKYRGLAGDEETAIKFFRDAYKEKPEIVGAVLGEASVE